MRSTTAKRAARTSRACEVDKKEFGAAIDGLTPKGYTPMGWVHEGYDITGVEQPFEFEVVMDGEPGNGGPDWTSTHEDGPERCCSAVVFFLARGRR